jgi:molybdate transport system substrate-binding protein
MIWQVRTGVCIVLLILAACGGQVSAPSNTGEVLVFAAASLTDAFGAVGKNFEAANPGAKVTFNFGGSQQLAQQIIEGAPADVFASANARQMQAVIDAGQVVGGAQQTFVRNRLVVVYPEDNPAGLRTLQDLAQPGLKIVLAAKEVPVGEYSLDVLTKASQAPEFSASYRQNVLANVVSYEESVRVVLSKVALGEADAGIVYTSDTALDAADQVGRIDIPDTLNTIAAYPIAPVTSSKNPELAQRFIDYVLSADAQTTLERYGFIPATLR